MSFQYDPPNLYKSRFENFQGKRLVALVREHHELLHWALDKGLPPIAVLLPALWELLGNASKKGDLHQLMGNILGAFATAEGYAVDPQSMELPPNRCDVKTAATFRKL